MSGRDHLTNFINSDSISGFLGIKPTNRLLCPKIESFMGSSKCFWLGRFRGGEKVVRRQFTTPRNGANYVRRPSVVQRKDVRRLDYILGLKVVD